MRGIIKIALLSASLYFAAAPANMAAASMKMPLVEKNYDITNVQDRGEPRMKRMDRRNGRQDERYNPPQGRQESRQDHRENLSEGLGERREDFHDRLEALPPEKRRQLIEKRQQLRDELSGLPPEERRARIEELRETYNEKREMGREEQSQRFQQHWQDASPAERQAFCDRVNARCDENDGFACSVAQTRCKSE